MRIPSTTVRLGAVLAAAALSLALACPAFASSSFSDVPDDAWYGADKEACVEYVAERGFMTGYAGTDLFGPEDTLTRAQAVTALFRAITGDPDGLTSDPASYAADQSGFADVHGRAYYTAALNWAVSEGVARGHDGLFRPDEPVTREELVTLMVRAVDYEDPYFTYSRESGFPYDERCERASEWAADAIDYATRFNIIKGERHRHADDGRKSYYLIRFHDEATRAETAAMLMRFNEGVVVYRAFDPKVSFAMLSLRSLEEGTHYVAGEILACIDPTVAVEGSELCFGDYAEVQIRASREASFAGDPAAAEMRFVDAERLALPSGSVDALSAFGRFEMVASPWFEGDGVLVLLVLPADVGYEEGLNLLAADERVMWADLNYQAQLA